MAATSFSNITGQGIQYQFDRIWSENESFIRNHTIEEKVQILANLITNKMLPENHSKETLKKIHTDVTQIVAKKLYYAEAADVWSANRKKFEKTPATPEEHEERVKQFAKLLYDRLNPTPVKGLNIQNIMPSDKSRNPDKTLIFNVAKNYINNNSRYLGIGLGFLEKISIPENDLQLVTALDKAKHDPDILSCQTADSLWAALENKYPVLTMPENLNVKTKEIAFNLFKTNFEATRTVDEIYFKCMKQGPKKTRLETIFSALGFIHEIAETPTQNLHKTRFYKYLWDNLGIKEENIKAILDSFNFGDIPDITKKRYGMLYLAAHLPLFNGQAQLVKNIFGKMDEEQLAHAYQYFQSNPLPDFENPLSEDAKSFISIGVNLARNIYNEDTSNGSANRFLELFPSDNFWHSHILSPTQQEILINGREWLAQALHNCQYLYDSMLSKKDTCPFDMHKSISEGAKIRDQTHFMIDETGAKIFLTEQMARDFDRSYEELIIVPQQGKATVFPGEYKLVEAGLAVIKSLDQIAEGDDDLRFMLQELASQSPQIALNMQWITQDLAEIGVPNLDGFLGRIPHTISTAIQKVNKDLITIEYDYLLMVTTGPNDPPKNYSLRYTLDIKRNAEGKWIVQQPVRTPLDQGALSLDEKYKPTPAPRDERLVYLRQPDVKIDSNPDSNVKGKEKAEVEMVPLAERS